MEESKGEMEWGEYLTSLVNEIEQYKRKEAFRKLRELLTPEDYENMRESSRLFRKEFKLR